MTAEVDTSSALNKGKGDASLTVDLFREFDWSAGTGTFTQVAFPGMYPDLTRWQAEVDQRAVNQGQEGWKLDAVQIMRHMVAALLTAHAGTAQAKVVKGGGKSDLTAVVQVTFPAERTQNIPITRVTLFSPAWKERDAEHGFPDPLLDLIAARFRLLGEPVRLKILAALTTGERNVGELVMLTGAGQPNVSRHLAALAQGGLITRHKVGTSIYYAIADPVVSTLCDVVCASVQRRIAQEAQSLGLETASSLLQKDQHATGS